MLPSSLPHLLANLPSGVGVEGEKRIRKKKKKKIKTLKPAVSSFDRLDYYGGQSKSGKVGMTTSAADSLLPRPLLASRDPIDEEGTFVAFCPHVMHADCKANSTRQMNYLSSVVRVGKFKCPVCSALSNFDLPLYDHVTDGLSPVWLSRQLTAAQSRYELTVWLRQLQRWLDERPPLASSGSAPDRQVQQKKDLPASLQELYRLIDLFKSSRGGLQSAKSGTCKAETISSVRLSELQAYLTKIFRTCRSTFRRRETQLTLPTLIQPASTSLRISTTLRVLGGRLAVLSRDSQPDMANSSFVNPVETDRYPALQLAINDFYLGIHNCFAKLRDFAHFAGLDFDDIWSKDSANETTAMPPSVFPPDSVTSCRQWMSDFRAYVERTQPLGLRAVWLAACEWRALRHTVAYTLVVWERYLRHLSPATNFFNGGLSDYYKTSLGYLLRATFQAHARLAPVSRGCRPACQDSDDETGQCAHAECWLQRRNDPDWWWWYSYFSPAPSEATDSGCCRDTACMASDLLEPVTRVAVTQDAARLWRLLLPEYRRQGVSTTCETVHGRAPTEVVNEFSPSTIRPTSSPSINDGTSKCREESFTSPYQSVSVLWEADITFLFVNLLFLRPGVEEEGAAVECQRLQSLRTMGTSEAVSDATAKCVDRRSETPPLAACDEGFPRLPIGDSHEAFLLRLCYLALLVQALLSWQGNEKELDATKSYQPPQQESVYSEVDPHVSLWLTNKLLTVRGRLRLLCGLSDCDSPPTASSVSEETGAATAVALKSLFAHLRSACLPFLRIAAFILQEITNIEVPAALCQPSTDKSIDEFIVLLAYLGLPLGPEDLLAVLSVDCDLDDANEEHSVKSQRNDSSSSFWLARLITSWCLVGCSSHSRNLYSRLRQQLTPQITTVPPLLPEPQICVPHLIRLPQEHVSLLALVAEWKNEHPEASAPSYPSLCLVCGTVASFLYPNSQQSVPLGFDLPSTFRLKRQSCDMQIHVGRNHAGYAFILLLQMGNLLLLSDHARQMTKFPELYRDEFGEPDTHLRRGCPLFLDEAAYRRLNETWLKHEAIQSAP
uniref:E3 ubiquitin-protein ligase n=1 Tax=Schistocephalus solidus TaxID=70667 RepID=A0A0X3PYV3_SCHSO